MPETRLKIKLFPDPVLRKKAKAVKRITAAHRDILSQMAQLMYAAQGVGLAASQVGISEAMIVVDIGTGLYKLINPKIVKREGAQVTPEGCLSIPGITVKVKRAKKITLKAQDESADPVTIQAEDLLACVFQHEIEHLRGKLTIDYATLFQRWKIKKKLEDLKKSSKDEWTSFMV